MSETANICKIAEDLSTRLLKVFGWEQVGVTNFNFQIDTVEEGKRKTKYPCDAIFSYADPFTPAPTFLATDLKSYSKSSIEDKRKIKAAITGLAKTTMMATQSSKFQKYLPDQGGRLGSFLFIHNHDLEFDKDFEKLLLDCLPSPLELPATGSYYIFGPTQIQFLLNILNDLEKVFGERHVFSGKFRFFYPNQILAIPEKNEWPAATPDLLLSPYVPIIYDDEREEEKDGKFYVKSVKVVNLYYRGNGSTYEEFCFLLDYLFRYNVIEDVSDVRIKMHDRHEDHEANFKKAKVQFSRHFYDESQTLGKLNRIALHSIPAASYKYSETTIGLGKRKEFANGN